MPEKQIHVQHGDSSFFVVVGQCVYLILVAFLWGFTNPMLKQSSQGIENIKKSTKIGQFFAEVNFLVSNWKYMIPFLINQSGSLIFYLCLTSANLSLAVPVVNSMTFVFTAWAGKMLGEKDLSLETIVGSLLITAGVALCVSGSRPPGA